MTVTDAPAPTADAEPEAPSTDLATQPEGHTALAELAAGTGLDTIPGREELAGLAAMAVTLAAANAVPDALRNKPNDVFLVLLTGRELGMGPAAAVRTLYVVNGKVTLPPKARAAAVRQRGLGRVWPHSTGCQCGLEVPYNDGTAATWHTTKADEGHQVTYSFTFTMADAARAPEKAGSKATLADKYTTMGYPQRMLSWRALGYLLDDHYPEVGTGLYSADEMGAMVDEDGHVVIDLASTDPLGGMHTPRGHAGATPPPPPPEADPEAIADLQARIDALPTDARPALIELWMAQRDGAEPMAALAHLPQRQLARARGMVSSVEARAKRGEWGPWPVPVPVPPADNTQGKVLTEAEDAEYVAEAERGYDVTELAKKPKAGVEDGAARERERVDEAKEGSR